MVHSVLCQLNIACYGDVRSGIPIAAAILLQGFFKTDTMAGETSSKVDEIGGL